MNYRIILAFLLVAYSLEISAAPKRRSMSSRSRDEKGKEFEKKEEQRFILKARTPRNLSSHERRIAKIFSDNVIPIAQGLALIAGGKEVQTAREAKIKLREQKAQTALRSRTATGRHRHASTPSSRGGGGFGGTSWGGGGYRPSGQGGYGWGGGGGYRPTPNYGAPSSYSPSSTWGQSSPTSYGSPSSSSSDDKTKKDSARYGGSDKSKKEKEKEELKKETRAQTDKTLDTTYKATLAKMQSISQDLASIEEKDKKTVYQNRLKLRELSSITSGIEIINKTNKKLNLKEREIFEKNYVTDEHKKIVTAFLPYLIRFLTVSTHELPDNNRCTEEQSSAADKILNHPFITTTISRDLIKSIAAEQELKIASYYKAQALPYLTQLQSIAAKEPPKLVPEDQEKQLEALGNLKPLEEDLLDIQAKFQTYLINPTNIKSTLIAFKDAAQKSISLYKKIKNLADEAYDSALAKIKADTTEALTKPDKKAFYEEYLKTTAINRIGMFKNLRTYLEFLKNSDQTAIENKCKKDANKKIAQDFLPHLLGLMLYPADDASVDADIQKIVSAQKDINKWIQPVLAASIDPKELTAAILTKDQVLAAEYRTQAQPDIDTINAAGILLAPVDPAITAAVERLTLLQETIRIIIDQKFPDGINEPKNLNALKLDINTAIAKVP